MFRKLPPASPFEVSQKNVGQCLVHYNIYGHSVVAYFCLDTYCSFCCIAEILPVSENWQHYGVTLD